MRPTKHSHHHYSEDSEEESDIQESDSDSIVPRKNTHHHHHSAEHHHHDHHRHHHHHHHHDRQDADVDKKMLKIVKDAIAKIDKPNGVRSQTIRDTIRQKYPKMKDVSGKVREVLNATGTGIKEVDKDRYRLEGLKRKERSAHDFHGDGAHHSGKRMKTASGHKVNLKRSRSSEDEDEDSEVEEEIREIRKKLEELEADSRKRRHRKTRK